MPYFLPVSFEKNFEILGNQIYDLKTFVNFTRYISIYYIYIHIYIYSLNKRKSTINSTGNVLK